MLDTLEQTFMKSKRKEEKDRIMENLQYILSYIGVSKITLCTTDTIIRIDEEAGNLYSCKDCVFNDTEGEYVLMCPLKWEIKRELK